MYYTQIILNLYLQCTSYMIFYSVSFLKKKKKLSIWVRIASQNWRKNSTNSLFETISFSSRFFFKKNIFFAINKIASIEKKSKILPNSPRFFKLKEQYILDQGKVLIFLSYTPHYISFQRWLAIWWATERHGNHFAQTRAKFQHKPNYNRR